MSYSTNELPLSELLRAHGVAALDDPSQRAQELGLRVAESGGSVQVKAVLRGGAAEHAGFSANDEWIGIELPAAKGRPVQGWRLTRLDDLALYLGPQQENDGDRHLRSGASCDRRLTLPTGLPLAPAVAQEPALLSAWLVD